MKTNKFGIAAAAVAGLIACGSIVHAQDNKDSKDAPKREGRPPGGPRGGDRGAMMKERLDKLAEELKLTDAQKTKVEAVMKEQGEKRAALRDATPEERQEKAKALREEMTKKMKGILNAEQFEKWQKMAQQRGPGGPGRRGGPGGPDGDKKPEGEKKADDKK